MQLIVELNDLKALKDYQKLSNLAYILIGIKDLSLTPAATFDFDEIDTIIEEFAGMDQILITQHEILFQLLCKLQGLNTLKEDESFSIYRGIIFECINLIVELKSNVC